MAFYQLIKTQNATLQAINKLGNCMCVGDNHPTNNSNGYANDLKKNHNKGITQFLEKLKEDFKVS